MRHRRSLPRETARTLFNRGQTCFLSVVVLLIAAGAVFERHVTAIIGISATMAFMLCFFLFMVICWIASERPQSSEFVPVTSEDRDLPLYSILLPLFKEGNMLPSLVAAIEQVDYPKDQLQVLILLEENDEETQAEAIGLDMPDYFEVLVVPKGYRDEPQGKPRALNYGLERVMGAITAVYDAEDRPATDQLLKAVAAFRQSSEQVSCVQARLEFWNKDTSWITWFYWMEYVVHFNWVLPGLAKLNLIPPLGGTSNHFRTEALLKVGGWDSWNVTEDADLAGALAMHRYQVKTIDSVTYEEATYKLRAADKQRRRWLKGFLQTGCVYTRHPVRTALRMGPVRWFAYVLMMFAAPVNALLSIFFWAMTWYYVFTRSSLIERLFPLPLYYTGLALLILGNLIFIFQLLFACLKLNGLEGVQYIVLVPVWAMARSYTACRMIIDCRPSKLHYWDKTQHGHDLHKEVQQPVRLDNPDLSPKLDPV